jgi:hypothetical protein
VKVVVKVVVLKVVVVVVKVVLVVVLGQIGTTLSPLEKAGMVW